MGNKFGNNLILCMKIRVFLAMTFWTLNTFNEFLALLHKIYCLKMQNKEIKKDATFWKCGFKYYDIQVLKSGSSKNKANYRLAVISACFTKL